LEKLGLHVAVGGLSASTVTPYFNAIANNVSPACTT
jgi:hypothetical protein